MENYSYSTILLFSISLFLSGIFIGIIFQKINNHQTIKKARKDAITKSRSVIGGQISEQIAPFLPEFPCNPGDARFIGKPVDFIAFPGSTEGKEIKEVLLIEVKTGTSHLSERERQIKECVEKGKVRYVIYNATKATN